MSDLGRRLRQTLDEVAPPADLDRIVAREPVLPFWRIGRVLAYAAVLVAVVGLTGFLLTRGTPNETVADTTVTTVQGTVTTTIDQTITTTTLPAIELVASDAWPYPALNPVFAMGECELADIADFIYEEFPDLGGRPTTSIEAIDAQTLMPLPRIGVDSVFGDDPAGWCLSVRQIDDVTAWKLQGPDRDQYVFAASRPRESNSVPDGVIDDYYHQSRIASGHGFNVSVRPEGRAVGVVDHDYFVMAGTALQPASDLYLWGEDVAMSLYKAPLQVESWVGFGMGGLFDPARLPAGFGPCTIEWLVWEQSGEGAEWFHTLYCDGFGNDIEILHGFGGDYPPAPTSGSEPWGTAPMSGAAWIDPGRRNIAFDVNAQWNVNVWVTASQDAVTQEELAAVTQSMLLFRRELIDPRKGSASFPGAADPDAALSERISNAVSQTPTGVVIDTNQWPDDGSNGTMFDQALALGVNRIEGLDNVDVVVADLGDRVQAIFSCGGLWFNIHIQPNPTSERADATWSQTDGRYGQIVDWLQVLEDSLGCTTDTTNLGPPDQSATNASTITLDVNLVPPDVNSVVIRNGGFSPIVISGWRLESPGFPSLAVTVPDGVMVEPGGSYGVHQIQIRREGDCPPNTGTSMYLCYSALVAETRALHPSGITLTADDGVEVARWAASDG